MRTPWKEVVIALLVGLTVGWFAAARFAHESRPSWKHEKLIDKFSRELELDADQKAKIEKILELKREQFTALRNEVKPRFEQIRNASKTEIQKLLTPLQQQKFGALEARWEERREKRRARWQNKPDHGGM